MRYVFDNDLHIHSKLSLCSDDPLETADAILDYAIENKLKTVCLTDHFWDAGIPREFGFYKVQNYAHVSQALPLPTERAAEHGIEFLFGCETDLDKDCTLGLLPENYDLFDFIVIPTTHLHMSGFTCRGDEGVEERAQLWIDRFDALLDMNLPFHKVGIAHLTCSLTYRGHHNEVFRTIPDSEYHRLFARCAKAGVGIELNFEIGRTDSDWDKEAILKPYIIARQEGCKFYFGSDAHHPAGLAAQKERSEKTIDLLGLTEDDKFFIGK